MPRTVVYLLLIALVALTLAGCPVPPRVYVPSADRGAGLPVGPTRLIEIADRLTRQGIATPTEADRPLAALERALGEKAPKPFEVLWRLGRATFLMAETLPADGQMLSYAKRGVAWSRRAAQLEPARVEGHYYLALDLAKQAEASDETGPLEAVIEEAKAAAKIDARYDDAGPLRLMGKVYLVAPAWPASVGDRDRAVAILKKAVSFSPTPLNQLFLGEAFYHVHELGAARTHLARALRDGTRHGMKRRWLDEARSYLNRIGAP